jgi:mono/diheme cytochrome c family protein
MRALGIASLSILLLLASPTRAADPVYQKNCASCHGPDGRARTPAGRKAGAHDLRQSKATREEIIKSIKEGRTNKAGQQAMPAFGDKLSAAELESLVKVVLGFRE